MNIANIGINRILVGYFRMMSREFYKKMSQITFKARPYLEGMWDQNTSEIFSQTLYTSRNEFVKKPYLLSEPPYHQKN